MLKNESNYHEQERDKYSLKLSEELDNLPKFVRDFIRSIEQSASIKTRVAYVYDLKEFIKYVSKVHLNGDTSVHKVTLEDIDNLSIEDIEIFLSTFTDRLKRATIKRKLSTLRKFYKQMQKRGRLSSSSALLVDMPKLRSERITILDDNEVDSFISVIRNGSGLTSHALRFHKRTKERDLAIVYMLLGTGMRVSELVGLNLSDINLEKRSLRVIRKGDKEAILFYSQEVMDVLQEYLILQSKIIPEAGHEGALFLSLKNMRLTTRSVQYLVEKYSNIAIKVKKISPHKLRSTFGSQIYKETGDIKLTSDLLGHSNSQVSEEYYVRPNDDKIEWTMKNHSIKENR